MDNLTPDAEEEEKIEECKCGFEKVVGEECENCRDCGVYGGQDCS